jgi:hypothetical protein
MIQIISNYSLLNCQTSHPCLPGKTLALFNQPLTQLPDLALLRFSPLSRADRNIFKTFKIITLLLSPNVRSRPLVLFYSFFSEFLKLKSSALDVSMLCPTAIIPSADLIDFPTLMSSFPSCNFCKPRSPRYLAIA